MIMMFNHIFQQIHIVFLFLGGRACSFICHVKSVQNISTTFEYAKIARKFTCNSIFLILCLILCVFLIVYIFVSALRFVFPHREFVDDDAFDSSSFVNQICDKVLSTSNYFNSLSYIEQTCEVVICFVAEISVIIGYLSKLRASALIIHFASCLVS